MKKGIFITLEGVEGSGKSLQARRLDQELRSRGLDVVLTSEPGATDLGLELRRILLLESVQLSSMAELFLFAADRAQHVDKIIRPALERGRIVICDRFMDSTVAYQGFARGLGPETVAQINALAVGGVTPDITFLLDLDPEHGFKRIGEQIEIPDLGAGNCRLGFDRIEREKIEFHQKVREGYLKIARQEPGRIKVLPAARPPDSIFNDILKEVDELLKPD